ncbi:VWA domain-containing protein [Granulicella arctica]|uniref:VWFA-related protein n=1 Tax=Granulicella arctica TaxID=940613 RepID=A0A7Y9PEQ8_9BACT|nr:VWA domain-containing protein [Granulicella arctica]NYF77826.1 VWFA-related protein [Granulicella arctica]
MNTSSLLILRAFFRFALLCCLANPILYAQMHMPQAPVRQPQRSPDEQRTEPVTTLKVAVRRVLLDVTVTDAKGKPVPNLKPKDFMVFEDKTPQVIRSFEVHKADSASPAEAPKLPTNTFANISLSPSSGPTTVILYDLLNTPQDSQSYAHEQLLTFLRQHKNGGQTAIFVLSDRLHMLQGFTEDDNKLIAALSRQTGKGYRSGLLQQSPGEATQSSDQLAGTEGNQNGADAQPDAAFQQVSTMLKHMETMETSYLNDRRVDITVEALQEIARFLIGLPGRKNLLWLSGSFPSGILPDQDISSRDSFDVTRNYSKTIVEATDLLTVSHVAVYPVDVRGLQSNAMFSAANNQVFEPGQGKDSRAVQNFSQNQAAEHATMSTIADATGGHAFYNTNGLAEAEEAAVQDGSLYYSLSYAPTNATYDGTIRRVRIELKQPGYHLAYRHTYFADNLDNVARNAMDNPDDLLAVSLEHGAPAAHELFFEAHVQVEGAPVQATPGQMQELVKYEAMATKNKRKALKELSTPVMLQRYVIQYVLLPRQLDISMGEDAIRRDHVEFAVISYNEDGLTLNGLRTQIEDVIHPDRWSMMLSNGYHVPMAVLIPVQARSMRLAVHDLGNNHVGSLELSLPLDKEDAAAGNATEKPGSN